MAGLQLQAYSFTDIMASVTGPGGSVSLGDSAGPSDEGITIEREEDVNTMVSGADGSVIHSLHAAKTGTITFRLLKTSPANALLQAMYDLQRLSSALWGQNIINITNIATGETTVGRTAAFKRFPSITNAKDATMQEWAFAVGFIDTIL